MLRKILLVAIIFCNCSVATARWATFADAPIEVLTNNMQINVKSDGSAEFLVTKKIRVLNERGRESNAKIPLHYNADNSKFTIVEAKTIVNGQEFPLNKNLIEDKPLASEVHGFDQTHQVLLAFPNVNVGSEIYVQYKLELLKADIPGFFEYMFEFAETYINNTDIQISSQLPLYTNVNDPEQYLAIQQGKDGALYTLSIKLKRPVYIDIVDEKNPHINPKKYPWIFIASSDNWQDIAQKFATPYARVLKQPLPAMYQRIADEARQIKDPKKQIAMVAALLNENVQYMGDWKTSQGRHVPQDLANVTTKRLGDCKDFATGMVAILQNLGIKANVALVQRGEGVYETNLITLPGAFHFNHAMVRVELADKKVLWVDPTNFFSISDKILPDIADRQAAVLEETNSHLERIPASDARDSTVVTKKALDLTNTDLVAVKTNLSLQGLSAIKLTGAGLQVSQDTINNAIVAHLGNYDNIVDKKVISPKLDSRLVSDLNFEVDYKERNMLINTNAGKALLITNDVVDNFIFNTENVSDVYLGTPKVMQTTTVLNNVQVVNTDNLDYTLQSPWIDVIRNVKYKNNTVIVDQKVIIKTSWIYNDIIRSPEYRAFEAELAKNFKDGVAIVFNK